MHVVMALLLMIPTYHVNATCHWEVGRSDLYGPHTKRDNIDILFDVNNASDKWMYLWMGHPNHGEDNGNLNLKPHSSARAIGCSNGAGYAVNGIIVTQGKDVLYTFDVDAPHFSSGWVTMHTRKGGCYVAWDMQSFISADDWPVSWKMSKMASNQQWSADTVAARVRIDCV